RPDVRRDRREQAHVGLAEPAVLVDALDADRPDRPVPDQDRDAEVRPDARPNAEPVDRLELVGPVHQQWLTRLQDLGGQAFTELERWPRGGLAALDAVREGDEAGGLVEEGDVD